METEMNRGGLSGCHGADELPKHDWHLVRENQCCVTPREVKMAQNSAMSLKEVTHKAATAIITTTTTTTTTDRKRWEQQCKNGGDQDSHRSFVGFELDSRSAKLISDLKQILMKKGNFKVKDVSGLNGVIRKGEGTRPPLSADSSVESESLCNLKKSFQKEKNFEHGMKKKDNLVNVEKMALHDKTCGGMEDVCFVSLGGDALDDNNDDNSTDIIIIKEIVHNNSPFAESGLQNRDLVTSSRKKMKEADLVVPYQSVNHKEPSPLVVELNPGSYSVDPEMEVMQESQYHLYAAPEIIEEVITVEDMEDVEEEAVPISSTFSTPMSSVILDHSYSSSPSPWLLETFNQSLQSHTERMLCSPGTADPQYIDDSDCETVSVTSDMMDGMFVCQRDGGMSVGLTRAAAAHSSVQYSPEMTRALPDGDNEATSVITTHDAVHQSQPKCGDDSNVPTSNMASPQPHITTDHSSSEPGEPRQDECGGDRALNTSFTARVMESPTDIPTSLPEGKSAQETNQSHKLDSPKENFCNRNSQIPQVSEVNAETDAREETGNDDSRGNQRAGSQERMLIRSSIQLRKRKIFKLIQVPQRESINFDKISDIDTYYTNNVTSFEKDLPASTEKKEIEKPPDLFPSSKAEKKAATKIWQVLVSQLEDCVKGITTLPPAVSVYTKKRKRSLSARKGKGSVPLQEPRKGDGHNGSVGFSCAENQDSQTSQCVKVKEGPDQATQSCVESRSAESKRKCVCFCRYNTVLPLASRRTCCGRRRVQSGCRRSNRTIRKEDVVFPTDQRTFFQSLGLMEKSLYDKDMFYESLVTHRTRNVRANQIKGKDHYRTFLDNLRGDGLDQSNEKLKQPLPLTFITKQNLCKLSTRSKAVSKGSNIPWLPNQCAVEHNFEGFCDTASSQRRSMGDTSLVQKFEFEPSASLGDVGSSSKSGTLPSVPFCCTDTNDNFTENCIMPKTQQDLLPELTKTSVDLEECPVCEKSDNGVCPLGHKGQMDSLNSRVLKEKGHSSLVVMEEEAVHPRQAGEGGLALEEKGHGKHGCESSLPDSWSDCAMDEVTEDTPAQLSLDQHSVSTSDFMEIDEDDNSSCSGSLPDLMAIGRKDASRLSSVFPAAAVSTPSNGASVGSMKELLKAARPHHPLLHKRSEECDFLGFDEEPHCHGLKTSPQLEADVNAAHDVGNIHTKNSFSGRSNLSHFMAVLDGQCDSVDVSKEVEELSCYAAIPKADKLSTTRNTEGDMESETKPVISLVTKSPEALKDLSLLTPKSPSTNEKTPKLGEFDMTKNCRVNLTKLKFPEGVLKRVRVDSRDGIVSPLLSTHSSPEKLTKSPEKPDSESHITLTRFSKRQNVKKIKYSELLKSNIRRSLNGVHRTERPGPASGNKHSRSTSDGAVFRCCTCLAKFRSKGALTDHLQAHEKKAFTCSECGLSFQEEVLLHSHSRLHTTAREAVLCEKCGESFSQLEDLRNHVKNHLSPKSPKCKMCNQTCKCQLSSNESLDLHLKDCKNRCMECTGTCVVSPTLKRNTRTHDRGKSHHCALCSDSNPHDN